MARDRIKTGSLTYQIKENLSSKLVIGRSKHYDKINNISTSDKIYSWGTYNSYSRQANYFAKWAKENHNVKTLEDARAYVDNYLQYRMDNNISAYTQKLDAAALGKIYNCSTKDFIPTQQRIRANISRSRGEKVRDKHFSESKNQEFVNFCRSTGLRREEIKNLTGDRLFMRNNQLYISVLKGTKGGRYREVPVINHKDLVVNIMEKAGNNKIFEKVPSGADIHSYRSDYASDYYHLIARNIEDIPKDGYNKGSGCSYQTQVYCCRGDLKGVKYDKVAMLEVSKALGHNRIDVIAAHYIK